MTQSRHLALIALGLAGLLGACAPTDDPGYAGSSGSTTYAGAYAPGYPAYTAPPTYAPAPGYAPAPAYAPTGYPRYDALVRTPTGEVITQGQLDRDRAAALDPRCRATPIHQDRPGGSAYDPWRGAPSC